MQFPKRARTAVLAVTAMATAASLAGCGGGSGASDNKNVTVWTSVDQPIADGFQEVLDAKAKDAGFTVKVEKVENINQLIMTKIQANDTPDIAMIPQPGVVKDIVSRGAAFPIDDVVDKEAIKDMIPGTVETGEVDGKLYGLLTQMNVKSFVFYNKKAFEDAGYEAPDSIEGLNALTDQIKADGKTPWCMGIEADTATGWPATDWFEDLVLRYGGPEGYDDWVSHKTKFDSDLVREAAAEFEELMFTDGNVLGGRKSISSTGFADAGYKLFGKGDDQCWLFKQGSFIPNFITEGAGVKLDQIGLFGFPPVEAGGDNPVLGAGDLSVLLNNESDNAKQVIKWLSQSDIGDKAAPTSSFISPHTTFDLSLYPDELTAQMAQVAYDATDFRFDGSDQMPGAVGAGSFWKEMTAWISGGQDLDATLKNIDDSWPAS
ncbi:ABC transporter substrate-binding protein [Nocardioides aurantiacus]|uniref:ABC transporter substrate-binding protein n=1 Tax=Nocardioides aurantiacus TaxID=86796 RepID=UPI00403F435D